MPRACPVEYSRLLLNSCEREPPRRKAVASRRNFLSWRVADIVKTPRDKPVASFQLLRKPLGDIRTSAPEAHGAVVAAGDQTRAVGQEGERVDARTFADCPRAATLKIPNTNFAIQ